MPRDGPHAAESCIQLERHPDVTLTRSCSTREVTSLCVQYTKNIVPSASRGRCACVTKKNIHLPPTFYGYYYFLLLFLHCHHCWLPVRRPAEHYNGIKPLYTLIVALRLLSFFFFHTISSRLSHFDPLFVSNWKKYYSLDLFEFID